jgi:hypothetical protein
MVIMSSRVRPANAMRMRRMAMCAVVGVIIGMPMEAHAGCIAMAPGADGVLRLDTGRGIGWSCDHGRHYAAAPSGIDAAPSRAPSRPPPQRHATAPAAPPAMAPSPAPEKPAPAKADVSPATPEGLTRLQDETRRLEDELSRLNDETAGLRAETKRLREQLSLRHDGSDTDKPAGVSPPAAAAGPPGDAANARAPDASAPKGDQLQPGPAKAKDQARAAASSVGSAESADQREFERRKGVAQRAWKELLDFAAQMRRGLSGKTE